MRILVLEDDISYLETIKEYLIELGFSVDEAVDGQMALELLYQNRYELALFDIRVPKIDGYELLKEMRKKRDNTPVIFLTSLTDVNNLAIGYELGCNDYIRKPFSLKELKYRIFEIIKRCNYNTNNNEITLKYGFSFCVKNSMLKKEGQIIELSSRERALVALLVKNLDRFLSINEIKDNIWSDKSVLDSDVRMIIKKIRDKTHKNLIISIRNLGYKIEKLLF